MSRWVGFLHDRKIYDDDPRLSELQCNADYYPVIAFVGKPTETKCDYCGRTNQGAEECKSCGAPLE